MLRPNKLKTRTRCRTRITSRSRCGRVGVTPWGYRRPVPARISPDQTLLPPVNTSRKLSIRATRPGSATDPVRIKPPGTPSAQRAPQGRTASAVPPLPRGPAPGSTPSGLPSCHPRPAPTGEVPTPHPVVSPGCHPVRACHTRPSPTHPAGSRPHRSAVGGVICVLGPGLYRHDSSRDQIRLE